MQVFVLPTTSALCMIHLRRARDCLELGCCWDKACTPPPVVQPPPPPPPPPPRLVHPPPGQAPPWGGVTWPMNNKKSIEITVAEKLLVGLY